MTPKQKFRQVYEELRQVEPRSITLAKRVGDTPPPGSVFEVWEFMEMVRLCVGMKYKKRIYIPRGWDFEFVFPDDPVLYKRLVDFTMEHGSFLNIRGIVRCDAETTV